MIPKIIHYCWFGNKQKPQLFLECLESWLKYCPEFKIIEWNEINSKQFSNKFYVNALRKKKYAFVADYIRAKVLCEFGGVYLDTDMLLVNPIEELLKYDFFSGYEVKHRLNYAFFGGVKRNHFFEKMISFYDNNNFNEFNLPVITHIFNEIINSSALRGNEALFSPEYFYPLTFQNKDKDYKLFLTDKTVAVHLWDHSWKEETKKGYSFILKKMKTIFLDYFFYNYSFEYFKKHLKDSYLDLYRFFKYKKI
jgi:mannosyltransferase OCH1-like enzyme